VDIFSLIILAFSFLPACIGKINPSEGASAVRYPVSSESPALGGALMSVSSRHVDM
jgi:hypothetical protein